MNYKLNYKYFPNFLKEMKKYNEKNKSNKYFKEAKITIIQALKNNPRVNASLKPHPLQGKLKGFWSIDTGLNSNSDRVIYMIDDKEKIIFLKFIGDHSVYESILEYWQENNLI